VRKYVFDASALLALLERTGGTAKVNELVKEAQHGRSQILMSSVNYGEVYGKVLRDHGQDQAIRSIGAVRRLPIELYDVDVQRALHAQDVKTRYKLYYIDSFAAALAIENKATLVTSDSDFRKLGHNASILWLKN